MKKEIRVETVLLRGILHFIGNAKSNFNGPIRKGLRPIAWILHPKGNSTSCSILTDVEIKEGESKMIEIVLLNQLQLEVLAEKGTVLNIGDTNHKFAEFTVEESLGIWQGGKVP